MGVGGGRGGGAGGEEAKKHVVDDDARFFVGVFSKRGSYYHVKVRFFLILFVFPGFGFFEKEKKKSAIIKSARA